MTDDRERIDCTECEQRLLDAADPAAVLDDGVVSAHVDGCPECREFLETLTAVKAPLDHYTVPEPPGGLVEEVLARATRPRPLAVAAFSREALLRVVAAGLAAFPLVVLVNALMGWAFYEAALFVLPRTIALYCIGVFAVWTSLGVALGYASLPFLHLVVGRPEGPLRVPAQ